MDRREAAARGIRGPMNPLPKLAYYYGKDINTKTNKQVRDAVKLY